jgi:drug/metabolite transporter (DMT)-like permease
MSKINAKSVFLLLALSFIWGASFILIKKGLVGYSADEVASLRVLMASLVFVPYMTKNFKKINFKSYKYILAFALLEIGIPPFLYSYAQTVVNSSTAGILNSLVPLFTLIVGFLVYKVSTNFYKTIGVLVGLLGAILLIFFKSGDFTSIDFGNAWGLLIVLATLMYGFGSNILKEYLQDLPYTQITAVAFTSMGIPAFLYLMTTDVIHRTLTNPLALHSLGFIALLSVFGSALAIIIFAKLVQESNALFASFVTYLIPFVAMIWGFWDGEVVSIMQIVCLLAILSGIYIANIGQKAEPVLYDL